MNTHDGTTEAGVKVTDNELLSLAGTDLRQYYDIVYLNGKGSFPDQEGTTESNYGPFISIQGDIRDFRFIMGKDSSQPSAIEVEDRSFKGSSFELSRTLLGLASLILPRKITDECFGDMLEDLEEVAQSIPNWRLQLQVLISVWWALIFTLRELAKPGTLLAAIWRLLFG